MNLFEDDESYRRAVVEHLSGAVCIHCDSVNVLVPGAGGRKVLAMNHRAGCPLSEDFGDDSGSAA